MLDVNKIYTMDCIEGMKLLDDNSIDAIVTDPPYSLGFMGKDWDTFKPQGAFENKKGFKQLNRNNMKDLSGFQQFTEQWAKEAVRVLKPGGHLLSFGGSRTYHRLACAIEDAGFEIRDTIMWVYSTGFPKSLNIGKAVDKLQGNEREVVGIDKNAERFKEYKEQDGCERKTFNDKITVGTSEWEGWGTALKPAHEPIVLARKPLSEKTVAENCLKWGTGGINIDGCRVEYTSEQDKKEGQSARPSKTSNANDYSLNHGGLEGLDRSDRSDITGRFPANFIHDGSDEVVCLFPDTKSTPKTKGGTGGIGVNTPFQRGSETSDYKDKGSAARFFYVPKASKEERNKGLDGFKEKPIEGRDEGQDKRNVPYKQRTTPVRNNHPTVKPIALIQYLIKLITPPDGIVMDPFIGSGTTSSDLKKSKNILTSQKQE